MKRTRSGLARFLARLAERLERSSAAPTTPDGLDGITTLRQVIDLLPHHIFIRDRDGRFILANQALASSHGLSPAGMEGRTDAELGLGGVRAGPNGNQPTQQVPIGVEETFTDATGAQRVVSTVRVPFQAGERPAVLGVSVDITERKLAREQERRLAAAVEAAARDWRDTFDSMRAAVMVLSLDGIVLRANRLAADWLSVRVASLPGQRWADLAKGEPWRRAAQLVEAVRAGGRGGGAEARDEGSGTAWEIRVDPAIHGGDGSVVLSIRDVTEMVEVRERARRNESLAALGSVVAGVAHEVRNPMFAISTHVEALALQGGTQPGQDESITALRTEVKRLGQLVTELLEYGRPHSPDLETLSVADVVRSAIAACEPLAARAGVEVQCRCSPSPSVTGDPARLRRVFVNLIENAVQHAPAGSTVEVTSQPAERAGQAMVECRVSDGGSGFAAGDLARAFEPFFTRRRGGTGLGLPIVRRIMEDHGGAVEAGNRPEGGAYVLVRLPVKEEA